MRSASNMSSVGSRRSADITAANRSSVGRAHGRSRAHASLRLRSARPLLLARHIWRHTVQESLLSRSAGDDHYAIHHVLGGSRTSSGLRRVRTDSLPLTLHETNISLTVICRSQDTGTDQSLWTTIKQIYQRALYVPERIQAICNIQFWSWIGWFPMMCVPLFIPRVAILETVH